MSNFVYIAHEAHINLFINPIYIYQTVGVANNIKEALETATRFFNIHENYHISTEYIVESLIDEDSNLIGWKIRPIGF